MNKKKGKKRLAKKIALKITTIFGHVTKLFCCHVSKLISIYFIYIHDAMGKNPLPETNQTEVRGNIMGSPENYLHLFLHP